VPAAGPPARDHLIPLGYQVLDGHLDFGEGVTEHLDELLGTLHAATDALRASGVVDDQVGGHYHIYEVHIPFVIDLIHKASGQGLVLFRRHARTRLVRAIEGHGEQERVVTTFYYYEGLTLREIGRVLDLSEGRISQILHSALVRLRQNLAEESRLSERT
jgi:DNA-directed RNA polymerase specialized sigma24 family protein